MAIRLRAVVKDGTLVPEVPLDLPDGIKVEVMVERPGLQPPKVEDPEERARLLKELVDDMKANPISPDAPRPPFPREWFYERD